MLARQIQEIIKCYNRLMDGLLDPSKYKPIGEIKCQTEKI